MEKRNSCMGNWEDGDRMNKKIKIQKVSSWSFVITIIVAVLFAGIAAMGRRENAIAELKKYFDGTDVLEALQEAQAHSVALMETEYYSMRLMVEASQTNPETWPEEIQNTSLTAEDEALTFFDKILDIYENGDRPFAMIRSNM